MPPTRHTDRHKNGFLMKQLLLLAVCRVAEPIAITSILPYAWSMVKDFHITTGQNASIYAGILVGAYAFSEAITSVFWGGLSDQIGRKPVVLSGCCGTIVSLMLVGLAPNFWVALVGRILGGALNGNIAVIQTMVCELVDDPENQPQAYAVMPFFWSLGTIIGPAIGGLLAKPAEGFPSAFSPNGPFARFPYLLPNLVCSVLLCLSILFVWLFLSETHPDMIQHDDSAHPTEQQPLLSSNRSLLHSHIETMAYSDENRTISDEFPPMCEISKPRLCSSPNNVYTRKVTMLVAALGIFTFHSMTHDHILPIFLQDTRTGPESGPRSPFHIPGGLGLSTQTVGLIMASDSIIALVIQSTMFPVLARHYGAWRLFTWVTILHPFAYLLNPFLVFLPAHLVFPGIYMCLIIRNILSILAYPALLILIQQAIPLASSVGKINGLAASAGAISRTVAPPLSGFLYSELRPLARWNCMLFDWEGFQVGNNQYSPDGLVLGLLDGQSAPSRSALSPGAQICDFDD
ncbi:MFS general substrate transporter [Aspergillus ellipticus CBS 707.79]|uniref:MFS general substrate transporter n=1 Tax=Aspergillus ellipticus CBS 707.79 TaxID=1448320 RepID=A0A319D1L8_9EURO|nr:MFS general substrate transporter [Aspergillus ellipticus CBS 707.79]